MLHGWAVRKAGSQSGVQKRHPAPPPPQENLILQRGELVWTVAGFLVMPKVSGS